MDFVAVGNTMRDSVVLEDGTVTASHMGGPSPFAYTGIRIWDDSVQMLTNVGADYEQYYGQWIKDNNICTDGISVVADKTHNFVLCYRPDGTYSADNFMEKAKYHHEIGYMEVRPSQFECTKDAKAVYFFFDCANRVFWDQLKEYKQKYGWQMMWEMNGESAVPRNLEKVKGIIKDLNIEMFSLNWPETKTFFSLNDNQKEEGIRQLSQLGAEMVFLRDGTNGSYVIVGDKYWHFDMIDMGGVDPTGCGNSSTGAAMYAYYTTKDPIMTGIMANISSSFNALQYGAIPKIDNAMRQKANQMAKELYERYTKHE